MTTAHKIPPEIFFRDLPKRHMSAGSLIFNSKQEMLIVKPSYKNYWQIPGGHSDAGETLRETAARETFEEIGIHVTITAMLCVNMNPAKGPVPDNIQSVFDAGILSDDQISQIHLQNEEIVEYMFLPVAQAMPKLGPPHQRIVGQAIRARELGTCFYLEDAENIFDHNN